MTALAPLEARRPIERPDFESELVDPAGLVVVERPLPWYERIVKNEAVQNGAILAGLALLWELYARFLDHLREGWQEERVVEEAGIEVPQEREAGQDGAVLDRLVLDDPLVPGQRPLDDDEPGRIDELALEVRPLDRPARLEGGKRGHARASSTSCSNSSRWMRFEIAPNSTPSTFLWLKASAPISARTRPGCGDSTRMREPTMIASSIEWVTNSTVNRS